MWILHPDVIFPQPFPFWPDQCCMVSSVLEEEVHPLFVLRDITCCLFLSPLWNINCTPQPIPSRRLNYITAKLIPAALDRVCNYPIDAMFFAPFFPLSEVQFDRLSSQVYFFPGTLAWLCVSSTGSLLNVKHMYRAEKKSWYVVARNFFLRLLNFSAWLGAA